MLGSLILYLKGMRILMFQLSGIYYTIDTYRTIAWRFMGRVVISPPIWVMNKVIPLMTLLVTTHEPSSMKPLHST